MKKIFEMPKNVIIPTARVEKAGEEVFSVSFDLALETDDIPLAMVYQSHAGHIYISKVLEGEEALLLHKLLTE